MVSRLPNKVKQQDTAIPCRIIKGTRNFYVHAYGSIDILSVWDMLNRDIPALELVYERILQSRPIT
ncbi:HepT-like ribonuclease domain-containing protein [uncultured Dysosmobacter sp.]|uniref:HepT-like ribonuclease domain-containing protein n=1 Tax=uncultured Dysosmobacter sp. TaxID=2591384 RepID=UPI00345CA11B